MRLSRISLLILPLALLASFAFADDSRSLFLAKCGSCHHKDGKAAPINPADKAAIVWKKYFQRGRHQVDLSTVLNEDELQSVLGYLEDYAADSDRPETAAIPK